MLHAEALLLVHDQQPQVLEPHLAGEQAVGADHDVHGAVGDALDGGLRIGRGLEAGQAPHGHREAGVALGEGVQMLLRQQRGGSQHRHLLAVLDGLEGGAHGDLGLPVAHVAQDQAVHRDRLLHVGLDIVDGDELVGGLHELEGVLQLTLPGGVGSEGVTGGGLPGGVQAHQLVGDLADRLAGTGLGLGPVRTAHAVDRRLLTADVLGDLVQLVAGNVQPVPGLTLLGGGVLDHQVLAGGALGAGAHGAAGHLHEAAHAVVGVDHVVTGAQLQGVHHVAAPRGHLALLAATGTGLAGEVPLGGEDDPRLLVHEPLGEGAHGDHGLAGGDGAVQVVGEHGGHAFGAQVLRGVAGTAGAHHGGDHRPAVLAAGLEVLGGVPGLAGVAGMGGGGSGDIHVGVQAEGG